MKVFAFFILFTSIVLSSTTNEDVDDEMQIFQEIEIVAKHTLTLWINSQKKYKLTVSKKELREDYGEAVIAEGTYNCKKGKTIVLHKVYFDEIVWPSDAKQLLLSRKNKKILFFVKSLFWYEALFQFYWKNLMNLTRIKPLNYLKKFFEFYYKKCEALRILPEAWIIFLFTFFNFTDSGKDLFERIFAENSDTHSVMKNSLFWTATFLIVDLAMPVILISFFNVLTVLPFFLLGWYLKDSTSGFIQFLFIQSFFAVSIQISFLAFIFEIPTLSSFTTPKPEHMASTSVLILKFRSKTFWKKLVIFLPFLLVNLCQAIGYLVSRVYFNLF